MCYSFSQCLPCFSPDCIFGLFILLQFVGLFSFCITNVVHFFSDASFIFDTYFFKDLLVWLFVWKSQLQEERGFHQLVHTLRGSNSQGWAQPEWRFMQISLMSDRGQSLGPSFTVFLKGLGRELDCMWNNSDTNQYSYGMYAKLVNSSTEICIQIFF